MAWTSPTVDLWCSQKRAVFDSFFVDFLLNKFFRKNIFFSIKILFFLVLFIKSQTAMQVLWEGLSQPNDVLKQLSGVDQVLPMSELDGYLAGLLRTNGETLVSADMDTVSKDKNYIIKYVN